MGYGKDCSWQGKEHRIVFAHPGDEDWCEKQAATEASVSDGDEFTIAPTWLASLSSDQLHDLTSDLQFMASKFNLDRADICEAGRSKRIVLAASCSTLLNEAEQELCRDNGLLAYYHSQVARSGEDNRSNSTLGQAASAASEVQREEMRIDPENGLACTLEELAERYEGQYSLSEIKEYWQTMQPEETGKGSRARTLRWPAV